MNSFQAHSLQLWSHSLFFMANYVHLMLHILRFFENSLVCNGNHYNVFFKVLYMSCMVSQALNINEFFIMKKEYAYFLNFTFF
jgi:hypothetical protein